MAGERILVVDDEPGVRTALEGILTDEGYAVVSVGSGEEGVEAVTREPFDAVLLDVWLPGLDGLAALERIRQRRADTEVVMISGHGTIETAVKATKLGAFDFVEKPLSLEKTLLVLRNALRQRRLERSNRRLREQVQRQTEIVGRSSPARKLRADVALASEVDAPVLILGEPGSGRETVARRIHSTGPCADRPFVEMPCGALDREAAERALFGGDGQIGRWELAATGSLFLHDVDRLDPSLQDQLTARLRAGSSRCPRPLATAALDATGLVTALRPMLDVIRIGVPALRERREDVPLLAERMMAELAREYGRPARALSPDCLRALKSHCWPGNLRELSNLMERLLVSGPEGAVRIEELPAALGGRRPPAEDLYREFATLDEGLEAFRRYYTGRVLAEERGDRAAAARRLGLSEAELPARDDTGDTR